MITFEWRITSLTTGEISGMYGVVTQIYFVLTGHDTETGREQGLHGSYSPPLDDVAAGIISYSDLTPEIVTGWLDVMPTAQQYREQVIAALEQVVEAAPALPWDSAGE